jgi:hypothetical protein
MHEVTAWRVSRYSAGQGNCIEVGIWRVSSYSADQGACVEVGTADAVIAVRDTKDRVGAVLRVPAEAWQSFIAGLR